MTECPNGEMRDLLPDLLHGRLDPEARALVEAHVDGCADCRAELALLRGMRASMHRVPAMDVGAIVAAIPARRAPAHRGWRAGGWRVAAGIALLVGGTSVALLRDGGTGDGLPRTIAVAPVPPSGTAPTTTVTGAPVRPAAHRELAVVGSVGELSDGELATLLEGIETLDAVPSTEVESGASAATESSVTGVL